MALGELQKLREELCGGGGGNGGGGSSKANGSLSSRPTTRSTMYKAGVLSFAVVVTAAMAIMLRQKHKTSHARLENDDDPLFQLL